LPADPREWAAWSDGLAASQAMGLRSESIDRGAVRMTLERSILPLNPNGAVHGGLVIGIADHVMGPPR
jgi:acyl-coenzyme A thioesterase PaaI-like protein